MVFSFIVVDWADRVSPETNGLMPCEGWVSPHDVHTGANAKNVVLSKGRRAAQKLLMTSLDCADVRVFSSLDCRRLEATAPYREAEHCMQNTDSSDFTMPDSEPER